jgi:hypothetical protein
LGSQWHGLLPARNRTPRTLLPAGTAQSESFARLLFRTDRHEGVLSRTLRKALQRVPVASERKLIAGGGRFTREAADSLLERGARNLAISNYYWPDESDLSVTQR